VCFAYVVSKAVSLCELVAVTWKLSRSYGCILTFIAANMAAVLRGYTFFMSLAGALKFDRSLIYTGYFSADNLNSCSRAFVNKRSFIY